MDLKDPFFESLTDEQLGFFLGHEHDSDLEYQLEDVMTPVQMKLFYNWKEKKVTSTSDNFPYSEPTEAPLRHSASPNSSSPITNMQEINIHEMMKALELRMESKMNATIKGIRSKETLTFDEPTQTGKFEKPDNSEHLRRELSDLHKKYNMIELENWSLKEKNEKLTSELYELKKQQKSKTTEVVYQSRVKAFEDTYTRNDRRVHHTCQTNEPQVNLEPLKHQEQEREEQPVDTSAVILPMSLIDYEAYKEREFLKTISNWQLGLYFALKYEPNCAEKMRDILNEDQYKMFEEARDNNKMFPLLDIASLSKEKKAIIKNLTLDFGKEISANAPGSSDISDSSTFRERQGSYIKKMNKEFLGGGLNVPDNKQSRISKLQAELRLHNSHSDSFAYSQMENHSPGLADDKQAILDKEFENLPMPAKDVNEEFEITAEYLQGSKEKAMESLPKETNILLLGESGVGKSTFLNAFANYLPYNSPDEALQSGVQVLTPVNCMFYDDESRKVPHPELQYCREIKDGYCQKCGCSWTHHMHMTEDYETTSGTMLPEYTSDKDEKNTLTKEKNLIQLEIDSILCSCAQFSSFIVANAMTGDQDVFRQAFDQMLREVSDVKTVVEKYMTSAIQYDGEHNVKNTKESELLRQLVEVKEAYIDKVSMNNAKNISLDTIERSVNDLQSLQSWKSVIEVVQEGLKKYNKDVVEKCLKETRDDRF